MDMVHVGYRSSKSGSDTLSFTVQPYGAAPAAVPWLKILAPTMLGAILSAVSLRKT
jgi:hypothetical protein